MIFTLNISFDAFFFFSFFPAEKVFYQIKLLFFIYITMIFYFSSSPTNSCILEYYNCVIDAHLHD